MRPVGCDTSAQPTVRPTSVPPATGSAIVRVIHASAAAPTVGIDLHDDDASAPEISGLDRFTASNAAAMEEAAAKHQKVG